MSQPSSFGANYQVFGSYTGSDNITSASPYILPPGNQNVATVSFNGKITLKLNITGAGTFAYSNTDFQFTGGTPSQVIILPNNAWKAADTARAALMASFTDFLQNLEIGMELMGTAPLGTASQVGQALADYIPAPLLESLFYRYSLYPGFAALTVPMVDVRPGMLLRVETEASQLGGSGFVGAGSFKYRVGSMPNAASTNGGRLVTFDPFLGSIKSPPIAPVVSPLVAGGLVDLCQTANARAYVRLFYPEGMAAASQPPGTDLNGNPGLVAAQTMYLMNQATLNYPTYTVTPLFPPPPAPQPPAPPPPQNAAAFFLGRATIVPEIPVWLATPGGSPQLLYVPVGTTLYQVIEGFMTSVLNAKPPAASASFLTRSYLSVNSTTFKFNPSTTALSTLLDVPLIAGDLVTLPA